MSEQIESDDYVLGSDQSEVARLAIQHDTWRGQMFRAWERAGLRSGDFVIDLGSGPGFASIDLARRVGPSGRVRAIERAPNFAVELRRRAKQSGLANIEIVQADVMTADIGHGHADALWCRWLHSFVANPEVLLDKAIAAIRPGGVLIFHEYYSYDSWRLFPASPALERFVELVMQSWRDQGGEPNVAGLMLDRLHRAGLRTKARPIVTCTDRYGPWWQWMESFTIAGTARLQSLGYLDRGEAATLSREIASDLAQPGAQMMSPILMEMIVQI